jgi:crossover junction endonuclease MUS81
MAKHRVAALVFRKSKWHARLNYWTGYLDEEHCSMISTSTLANNSNIIDEPTSSIDHNTVVLRQTMPDLLALDDMYEPSISFTAPPGTFDIILLIDNRELNGRRESKCIQQGLGKHKIKSEMRALPLGDALWVARVKTSTGSIVEMLLDIVLERKQIDDLIASIKDGRYHEQKVNYNANVQIELMFNNIV